MTYFVSEEAFNASNKHPHLYIGGKNVVHILFSFFLLLVFVFQLQSCQLHWGTSSQFPIRLLISRIKFPSSEGKSFGFAEILRLLLSLVFASFLPSTGSVLFFIFLC